ncbi:hypothetical protein NIES4103_19370 [Nostoc sp. NIES-4103]|nr:hypothetical protein NIES4103_19370 [Nostoc sp. NIES-4103]
MDGSNKGFQFYTIHISQKYFVNHRNSWSETMNSLNLTDSQQTIVRPVCTRLVKNDKLIAHWTIVDNKLVCQWIVI